MAMKDLHQAMLHELHDVLDAERRIEKALPEMAEKASNAELKSAFEKHLQETKGQINRLERVFEELGEKPKREKCEAMSGIIEEGEELLKMKADDSVKDAMLIAAAQKVEHYEIASYGTVIAWAGQMGHTRVKELLAETLAEEKETDDKLTALADALNAAASPA